MAIVVKDRVQETTASTGTADFVLDGAVLGFQSFSAIGNTHTTYYAAYDPAAGDWEVGIGTYSTTGPTLTRDTILSSSAAGAKVSFAAGTKNVFCTYPAEKAIYEEPSGNTLIDGGPLTVVGTGVTGYTSFSAVLAEMYGNVPTYAQVYARNLLQDTEASADMIVYRDNTTVDTANFMDMGINSSTFDSATWPIFTPGSMYLYGNGGEMFVGSETSDLIFFSGGVDTTDEVARFSHTTGELTTRESINITGDVNAEGGTFTAPVTTSSPSVSSPANNEFVTKSYVDNATSTGIHIHTPCTSETSAALSAVYTQGGTTFNITDITGTNTVVTSTTHGLSVNDEIWLYSTAGNGLSTNTAYFVYATPTTTSLQLSTSYGGTLLTGLTNASGLSYATRANSGVGAYLESSANEVLPVSGVIVGDRVLVYQQSTGYWNGVYTVTSLGSVGSKWKLTRATDANKYEPDNTAGMGAGDYFFIQSNSESYVLTDPTGPIIIGYDSITYTLFSSVPAYTVNSPLQLVGTTLSLTTVPATLGGTGTSTVATGDLLYGSATDTWSKLGVGSAYNVLTVNGSGTNVQWNALNLSSSNAVTGTLGATFGGTGLNSYATGDIIYSSASNTLSALAGNSTTTKKFLSQTGTGSGSAAPAWEQPAASDITGLAPSATTDTTNASNITSGTLPSGRLSGSYTGVTGVGTLTAGTWNANTVGAAYGGTGFATYTVGDILYASGTTTLSALADVAVGNALISGGVGSAPSWGKIGLATHTSGTLPIANGGTNGSATPTAGAVPYGTGTAYAFSSAGTSNQVLLSGGTGSPTWANQSALSVGTATTATNIAGGAANQIHYQTGSGATGFIAAPSVANTVLSWDGAAFTWAASGSWPAIVTPTNVSPANGATNQTYPITLTGTAFYDLYGYSQAAAQWQVSTSSGFGTTIINTGDVASLTSYTINGSAGLSTSTTYYWRVRYKNSNGTYSDWSSPTSFVTAASFAYSVNYLIVAGGGGGDASRVDAGGAGAGGYVSGTTSMNPGTVYTCTVGGGGTGGYQGGYGVGTNGSNSSISGLGLTTAIGGGHSYTVGGSGGAGAAGTAGQGNAGGSDNTWSGGGGGGAGAAGSSASSKGTNGYGGNGSTWLDGVTYAGGGGGGNYVNGYAVPGGTGGGGYGGPRSSGGNGTNGLGGGGGGGAAPYASGYYGGNGGSGVVIIRYAGSQRGTGGAYTSSGGYSYHTFISTGTYTA